MKALTFSKDATRALRRMDAVAARLIREKIDQFVADPASLAANVKRLKESRLLRLSVNDYRVIIDDHDATVLLVVKIGHRRQVYD